MEPTLVRRYLVGLLAASLISGAGAFGWARSGATQRSRKTDLPAAGGMLTGKKQAESGATGTAGVAGRAAPATAGSVASTARAGSGAGRAVTATGAGSGAGRAVSATGAGGSAGSVASTTGAGSGAGRAVTATGAGSGAGSVTSTAGTATGVGPVGSTPLLMTTASDRGESAARSGGRTELVHEVTQGETLFHIAQKYGVQVGVLQRSNGLASDLIRPGQHLVVPGGRGSGTGLSLGGTYIWPVLAPISSSFGPRWGRIHKGIDLAANHGDQIRASREGTVLIAGEVTGYGQTIVLEHQDGSRTLYAHSSKLLVSAGDRVKQGQNIALVGSTGQSTGPHLHFEIIVNDAPVDPLLHLPKR